MGLVALWWRCCTFQVTILPAAGGGIGLGGMKKVHPSAGRRRGTAASHAPCNQSATRRPSRGKVADHYVRVCVCRLETFAC